MPEAVWFPAPRIAELRSEASQLTGPSEVRVRALVSGISAGSELLVYRGEAPDDLPPDLPTVTGSFGFPIKFGYASVGRVIEVGKDVDLLAPDDVVFVHHPHQTEYVVSADFPIALPRGMNWERGVFTANLETAATVALDAHPRLGDAVVVIGQGVVGLLTTMLLRRTGAGLVIGVDLHEKRREASRLAGAHHALPPGDELAAAIRDLTGGRGVDVAIESSGVPSALQSCVDAAAFGATIVVASWYGTRGVTVALGGAFHRRRLRLVSSQVSTLDPAISPRWDRERRTRLVTDLLTELPLEDLITHRFPFPAAASAYELLDTNPQECLQVVLSYV